MVINIENISKALILIGSIIISIIIISLLVYSFAGISQLGNIKQDSDYVIKMQEYNRKFESFNRNNLYGEDIISIANLIEDYNSKNEDEFPKIEMNVVIIAGVDDARYFKTGNYDSGDIVYFISKLAGSTTDELHDFKLKKFECYNIEYNGNRLSKMQFREDER